MFNVNKKIIILFVVFFSCSIKNADAYNIKIVNRTDRWVDARIIPRTLFYVITACDTLDVRVRPRMAESGVSENQGSMPCSVEHVEAYVYRGQPGAPDAKTKATFIRSKGGNGTTNATYEVSGTPGNYVIKGV